LVVLLFFLSENHLACNYIFFSSLAMYKAPENVTKMFISINQSKKFMKRIWRF